MSRPREADRDVYGNFAVAVVNAARLAQRGQMSMSEEECRIVDSVLNKLIELDPPARHIRDAKIVLR